MKIKFRCDGNSKIGMGHVVRCSALASELKARSHQVSFLTKDEDGLTSPYLESKKIDFKLIDPLISKVNELSLIGSTDLLVLDSYDISEDYLKKLKAHNKLFLFMDTLVSYPLHADYILMPHAPNPPYNIQPGSVKLYGHDYIILRPDFLNLGSKRILNSKIENVLITFGGSDNENVTYLISSLLLRYEASLKLHLLLGPGFSLEQKEKLVSLFESTHHQIFYHQNISNVASLMSQCDLAIASASVTAYELCYLGIPTIVVTTADNQLLVEAGLVNNKACLSLGFFEQLTLNSLFRAFNLMDNLEIRQDFSHRAQTLVDGQGVKRVADSIEINQ